MFNINIDRVNLLIEVEFSGMIDEEEASLYVTRLKSEFVQKIGARPYVMMIDTRRCPLQSQSVLEVFRSHIETFPKASRLALVNGSSIVRMQLRRLLTRDYTRFFDTPAAARTWLLSAPDTKDA